MGDGTGTATGTGTAGAAVRRDGDRVWVEGVTGWFVGEKGSSVHAAHESAMRALGEDVTYDDLLGVSGLAFRMQVSIGTLCPSSPHAWCGYRCVDRSSEMSPWAFRHYAVKPDDDGRVAEMRRAIVDSIDRGVPVQYGSEEDGVIFGYRADGAEWLAFHPLHAGGREPFVETAWPWGLAIYTERRPDPPNWRAAGVAALRQAVSMAAAEEADRYYVGFAAWEDYIRQLEALDRADAVVRAEAMQGNAWIYDCLVQYRAVAARFLAGLAGSLGGAVAEDLARAGDAYRRMAGEVLRAPGRCSGEVAPYPWSLEDGETWSDDVRQAQIERLRAAIPLEHEAIDAIRAALAALNGAAPH